MKIKSVKWDPLLSTHCRKRSRKLSITRRVISYGNRPQSIEQLKDAIRQEIIAIPHEMTRRVIDNFRERLRQCVDNNGSHLTDLIFKT